MGNSQVEPEIEDKRDAVSEKEKKVEPETKPEAAKEPSKDPKSKSTAKGAKKSKPKAAPAPAPAPEPIDYSSDSPVEEWEAIYSSDDYVRKPRTQPIPDVTADDLYPTDDEKLPDPWNAVCIVGFKVYSKDEDLELRVIMEGGALEEAGMGAKGEKDLDNAQENAAGEREEEGEKGPGYEPIVVKEEVTGQTEDEDGDDESEGDDEKPKPKKKMKKVKAGKDQEKDIKGSDPKIDGTPTTSDQKEACDSKAEAEKPAETTSADQQQQEPVPVEKPVDAPPADDDKKEKVGEEKPSDDDAYEQKLEEMRKMEELFKKREEELRVREEAFRKREELRKMEEMFKKREEELRAREEAFRKREEAMKEAEEREKREEEYIECEAHSSSSSSSGMITPDTTPFQEVSKEILG